MFIKRWILILVGILALIGVYFKFFFIDGELTPLTTVWITNNSPFPAIITLEYTSEACQQGCKLELGTYSVNEGRGTTFPVPNEGDFKITAEVNGRTLVSDHKYVEKWAKIYPRILVDKIILD